MGWSIQRFFDSWTITHVQHNLFITSLKITIVARVISLRLERLDECGYRAPWWHVFRPVSILLCRSSGNGPPVETAIIDSMCYAIVSSVHIAGFLETSSDE